MVCFCGGGRLTSHENYPDTPKATGIFTCIDPKNCKPIHVGNLNLSLYDLSVAPLQ